MNVSHTTRLSSVNLPAGGGTVSFNYDPFGQRIQKTTSSGSTIYLYDGASIVAEVNSSGTVVASYAQGTGIDEPLAMQRGGYTAYYNADGLGSITSLTGGTGQLVATYSYDSFGNTTPTEGIFNPFRYTRLASRIRRLVSTTTAPDTTIPPSAGSSAKTRSGSKLGRTSIRMSAIPR